MNNSRWLVALPPEGAARRVVQALSDALKLTLPADGHDEFDCRSWQTGFEKLLKDPDPDMVADLLNQSLITKALDFRATHVLVGALCPVTRFALEMLKRTGAETLHWFVEDWRVATYWRAVLGGYDRFLAVQKGPLPESCAAAGSAFAYFPNATAAEPFPELKYATGDFAFVGIPTPWRIAALEKLQSAGFRLSIGGSGWENYQGPLLTEEIRGGWVDEIALAEIQSSCRVVLNLSAAELLPEQRSDQQTGPRVFDAVATGHYLLSEDLPLQEELLAGVPHATFLGLNDLCRAASRALDEIPSRDTLLAAAAGFRSRHSYAVRARQLLSLVSDKRS